MIRNKQWQNIGHSCTVSISNIQRGTAANEPPWKWSEEKLKLFWPSRNYTLKLRIYARSTKGPLPHQWNITETQIITKLQRNNVEVSMVIWSQSNHKLKQSGPDHRCETIWGRSRHSVRGRLSVIKFKREEKLLVVTALHITTLLAC